MLCDSALRVVDRVVDSASIADCILLSSSDAFRFRFSPPSIAGSIHPSAAGGASAGASASARAGAGISATPGASSASGASPASFAPRLGRAGDMADEYWASSSRASCSSDSNTVLPRAVQSSTDSPARRATYCWRSSMSSRAMARI